ncbi:MAG: GNAT family N-acetyltransferase [Acidimicrobiales bacterium]
MVAGLKLSTIASVDEPAFTSLLTVRRFDEAVRNPGDPEPIASVVAADLFLPMPDYRRLITVAEVDGAPAGYLNAIYRTEPDGDTWLAEVDVIVLPEFRRRGIATTLIDDALPQLADVGLRSVVGEVTQGLCSDESTALCQRYGLTKRLEERCSRAQVADVDRSMLAGWIADAARSSAYRVESWEGPCPDHLLDLWCAAAVAMTDAPTDDLEYVENVRKPEMQREADRVCVERGLLLYRSLALSDSDEPAGVTEIFVNAEVPQVGQQGETGVLAAHRGHRLGKWLKAVNFEQAVVAHPEMRVIETYNAQSNPWMLDINIAMGFAPHHVYEFHQAPIETVLAARSVEGSA